jgi:hypothetical protein
MPATIYVSSLYRLQPAFPPSGGIKGRRRCRGSQLAADLSAARARRLARRERLSHAGVDGRILPQRLLSAARPATATHKIAPVGLSTTIPRRHRRALRKSARSGRCGRHCCVDSSAGSRIARNVILTLKLHHPSSPLARGFAPEMPRSVSRKQQAPPRAGAIHAGALDHSPPATRVLALAAGLLGSRPGPGAGAGAAVGAAQRQRLQPHLTRRNLHVQRRE